MNLSDTEASYTLDKSIKGAEMGAKIACDNLQRPPEFLNLDEQTTSEKELRSSAEIELYRLSDPEKAVEDQQHCHPGLFMTSNTEVSAKGSDPIARPSPQT